MITHAGRTLFTANELRCKGSGKLILAPGFADHLLDLRVMMDEPMTVNSCCRSAAHNQSVGGHPRSLHVCDTPHWPTGGCCAIDIGTRNRPPEYRANLTRIALSMGWSVGVHGGFIHLDRRGDFTERPQAVFSY